MGVNSTRFGVTLGRQEWRENPQRLTRKGVRVTAGKNANLSHGRPFKQDPKTSGRVSVRMEIEGS